MAGAFAGLGDFFAGVLRHALARLGLGTGGSATTWFAGTTARRDEPDFSPDYARVLELRRAPSDEDA